MVGVDQARAERLIPLAEMDVHYLPRGHLEGSYSRLKSNNRGSVLVAEDNNCFSFSEAGLEELQAVTDSAYVARVWMKDVL